MKGKVKWYNPRHGYGFIKGEDGTDVFIHKSELPFWTIMLNKGEIVEYSLLETKKGITATNVKII